MLAQTTACCPPGPKDQEGSLSPRSASSKTAGSSHPKISGSPPEPGAQRNYMDLGPRATTCCPWLHTLSTCAVVSGCCLCPACVRRVYRLRATPRVGIVCSSPTPKHEAASRSAQCCVPAAGAASAQRQTSHDKRGRSHLFLFQPLLQNSDSYAAMHNVDQVWGINSSLCTPRTTLHSCCGTAWPLLGKTMLNLKLHVEPTSGSLTAVPRFASSGVLEQGRGRQDRIGHGAGKSWSRCLRSFDLHPSKLRPQCELLVCQVPRLPRRT